VPARLVSLDVGVPAVTPPWRNMVETSKGDRTIPNNDG
jgi:hypothetical protein